MESASQEAAVRKPAGWRTIWRCRRPPGSRPVLP